MRSTKLPSAVIFDMDGVLVDSEPVHTACYCQAFTEAGFPITTEQYRQNVTIGHFTCKKLFLTVGGNMERWPEVRNRKFELTNEMMHDRVRLMPGITELLETLQSERIPTALATSSGINSLEAVMGRFDLRPYFRHIVTSEDVKAVKPEPDGYIFAAGKLGVPCHECVAIEDSPRGVLAAHRAGMKCIAVPTSTTFDGDFGPANLVVKSLEEVSIDMLRGLFDEAE